MKILVACNDAVIGVIRWKQEGNNMQIASYYHLISEVISKNRWWLRTFTNECPNNNLLSNITLKYM